MTFNKTFALGGATTVNRLGFGAMRITGPEVYGMPEVPQKSIDVVRRAVDLGVEFIDTADQYGPFTSEQLICESLYPYPDNVVVATKGGLVRFGPFADINNDASPQHLEDALNGSLRRLNRDQIDLYQLHRIDPKVPVEATFRFLRDAQRDGRVRHLGLSEVSVEEIQQAQDFFEVTSVQNRYSIGDRSAEPVLDFCREHDIAFIPWFPIGGGDVGVSTALQRIANEHETGTRQIALAWLLHHSNNILLIPGTSNIKHLEQNMRSADIELDEEQMRTLDNITPTPA
ncbi:aldo/keto reductase [Actinoallomurus soli]|uniref:aldo/keto reductase n=1 Tax=Actinoallomurus soli TaxID=2952535 RepID=UPI002093776B|nr:aldo/keto reductase [Actinoallomurus soli]MCO5975048.1 aldo/keto reductase [Actinoallomurus soli]